MGKPTFWDWLKGWIGYAGLQVFLWSHNMTIEEYWAEILEAYNCE